jgi:RNA polymerase sigma-70 factor, ECF subfamily
VSGQVDSTLDEDVAAQILVLRPKLRHLAVRLTNNRADAEDLVQLAMVKALEFRGRLWRNTNLKAWLRTVMQHQVIDDSRRARRRAPWGQRLEQVPAPQPPPDEPGEVVWEDLSSEDVRRALARVPAPLRVPFELQQFEGRSLAEISVTLGVPRATVATRLFRVRARLRRLLATSTRPPTPSA